MKTKRFIVDHLRKHGMIRTRDIVRALRISRQTAHQHLQELMIAGKVIKEGATLGAKYRFASKKKPAGGISFSGVRKIHGLEEDRVYDEAELRMRLKKELSPAALKIVRYAFSEMLNNAISHSKASRVEFHLILEAGELRFRIQDRGIGVFESIRKKFVLKDPFEAVEHLLKGKQTTDPERHSGQGIFFTSKIADRFILSSQRVRLIVDAKKQDVFLEELRKSLRGTLVEFTLKQRSRKDLRGLFVEYSDEDYEFHKTKVIVHLSAREGGWVSRSEAKRILFGLEKFKHIILDFRGVKGIGQGFADEIFRVFRKVNPSIQIEAVHMVPAVDFMVKRAQAVQG